MLSRNAFLITGHIILFQYMKELSFLLNSYFCITDSMDMSLGGLREIMEDGEARHAAGMGSQRVGHD